MCRVVAYLGAPIRLGSLLYDSDSSLTRQAYDPTMLHHMNLAGCGLAAWDQNSRDPERPYLYKDTTLPMYDHNLKSLGDKLDADCLIAHLRGENYFEPDAARVTRDNVHPFIYPGASAALAHNGGLARFSDMKYDLLRHIDHQIAALITGTTDSEWIYALFLSRLRLDDRPHSVPVLAEALVDTIAILRQTRDEHGVATVSGLNLFVSDGSRLLATRYSLDFGRMDGPLRDRHLLYHTLWYTAGRDYGLHDDEWRMRGSYNEADSVLVASEPLTRDTSSWIEVPEYSLVAVERRDGRALVTTYDVDL